MGEDGGNIGWSIVLKKKIALRKLKIDICYPEEALSTRLYDRVAGSLGPDKVLNLAQLPFLRHVEVPLFMFAHTRPSGLGRNTAVPHDVLPQALGNLVLLAHNECAHPDGEACWDSMAAALEFLESLGRVLTNFDQLKTVAYCFRTDSCANPMRIAATESQDSPPPGASSEDSPGYSTRSRLQAINETFAEQNVKFYVKETISELGRQTIDLREWK